MLERRFSVAPMTRIDTVGTINYCKYCIQYPFRGIALVRWRTRSQARPKADAAGQFEYATPAKMQAGAVSINHEPAPNPCWQSSTAASQSDRSAPIAPSISPPPHAVSNAGIVGVTYY